MPTEENQNPQTSGNTNPVGQNDPVNQDLNLDIDLNLDGLDLSDKPSDEFKIEEDFSESKKSDDLDLNKIEDLNLSNVGNVVDDSTREDKQESVNLEKEKAELDVQSKDDDWLLEEDKKVEELEKGDNLEDAVKENSPKEDIIIHNTDADLENLDIPFVEKEPAVEDITKEDKQESVALEKEENETSLQDNIDIDKKEETNDSEKVEVKDINMDDLKEEGPEDLEVPSEFHIENISGDVIENKDGDIVSDTGKLSNDKDSYVPNENDFNKLSDALSSTESGGKVKLDKLEEKQEEKGEGQFGEKKVNDINFNQKSDLKSESDGVDLDSLISEIDDIKPVVELTENNEIKIEENSVVNTPKTELIKNVTNELKQENKVEENKVEENKVEENKEIQKEPIGIVSGAIKNNEQVVNQTFGDAIPQVQQVQQIEKPQVEQTVVPEVKPTVSPTPSVNPVSTTTQPNVAPTSQDVPVKNNTVPVGPVLSGIPAGAVIVGQPPVQSKNSHKGLKIFGLIIVLLGLGFFILTKMYPEEIGDIMSAIKGENQTVIEYEDSGEMVDDISLDEVVNEEEITGQIEELDVLEETKTGDEIVEDLDPDSLAAQIENNDTGVLLEEIYTGEVMPQEDVSHNASDQEFDAFGEIEEVIDSANGENDALIIRLQEYQDRGNEYDAWGRDENNTTAIKYGLYISRNAEEIINNIENGIEIDTTEVDDYFAQFDTYLQKLDNLRGDNLAEEPEVLVDEPINDPEPVQETEPTEEPMIEGEVTVSEAI